MLTETSPLDTSVQFLLKRGQLRAEQSPRHGDRGRQSTAIIHIMNKSHRVQSSTHQESATEDTPHNCVKRQMVFEVELAWSSQFGNDTRYSMLSNDSNKGLLLDSERDCRRCKSRLP